ncbi:MAG: nucleotide exchange factor GrpE [Flavobacteriaceae bacterium]
MSKKVKEKSSKASDVKDEVSKASEKPKKEKSQLDVLKEEVENEKDRYLRLFAEFENYKKRTAKERLELFKTAGQEVITSLLPVLDDFERALREIEKSEDDTLFKGVELISNKLNESLRQKGLQIIETTKGDDFNADIHEAITQIPSPSEELKGKIIDVIEKGYALGEKIIRYPKVVIGN